MFKGSVSVIVTVFMLCTYYVPLMDLFCLCDSCVSH